MAYLGLVGVLDGYPLGGVVRTCGCDRTAPALRMGAATVNIPAIALSVGPLLNGWNKGTRKTDSVDLYANGPFELFGRNHELLLGGSYSKQDNYFFNTSSDGVLIGDFNNWNGSIPQGTYADW